MNGKQYRPWPDTISTVCSTHYITFSKSKVQTEVLDEFLFADDMAKCAPSQEKMQKGVDQVSDSCESYDLTISIKKTEVVYQPAPGKP